MTAHFWLKGAHYLKDFSDVTVWSYGKKREKHANSCEAALHGPGYHEAMKSAAPVESRWAWHQKTLRRMREQLLRRSGQHYATTMTANDPLGSEAAERAGDAAEQELLLAELKKEEGQLAAIDAALARIAAGTYGICAQTGEPISAERLRALPWTPFSLAAANRLGAVVRGRSSVSK